MQISQILDKFRKQGKNAAGAVKQKLVKNANDVKSDTDEGLVNDKNTKGNKEIHGNWYDDRYHVAVTQRNILLILLTACLIGIAVAVLVVMYINSAHVIEPFVIEVEKKTGVATLIDTSGVKRFSANKAVNDYFLVKYINARELFDRNSYAYNWYTVVRLLSNGTVYRKFLSLASSDDEMHNYLNTDNAVLKIRSIQYLSESSVQIRFAIEPEGERRKVYGKVALVNFIYDDESLTREQRYVNPLGFLVTSYRVTDEFEQ
ncbi:Type IV secretion system protein [Candidatus Xenohaliotis californiensis]|uniref:Type IV secretion system protein n=1 Tax=Candidatus Xenohaliotis californiensis TaxID=84677 RepID=A0ABM9N777_9RICK|nr:Type IV secretion system protein [Candidatus Xenohaliotis californiensis]